MSTETNTGDRHALIEQYRNAQTETEKQAIREKLMACLTEREKSFYADTTAMAKTIAHIDRTEKALKAKRDETVGIAQVLGFPIGEKILVGNYSVYMTDTVNNVDSDELASLYRTDDVVAGIVDKAIDDKRAKITLSTLTLTDLKAPFKTAHKTLPIQTVKEVRCRAKPLE